MIPERRTFPERYTANGDCAHLSHHNAIFHMTLMLLLRILSVVKCETLPCGHHHSRRSLLCPSSLFGYPLSRPSLSSASPLALSPRHSRLHRPLVSPPMQSKFSTITITAGTIITTCLASIITMYRVCTTIMSSGITIMCPVTITITAGITITTKLKGRLRAAFLLTS